MSHNKILANRADYVVGPSQTLTDCCDDPILFAMEDKKHTFSMGLFTILKCLRIAEQEGYVPNLPEEWWYNIRLNYHFTPQPDK